MYSGQLFHALGDCPMKHEKTAFLPWTMQMRPQTGWLIRHDVWPACHGPLPYGRGSDGRIIASGFFHE
jgi:hypothetical protein